jgi:hypothetical protein
VCQNRFGRSGEEEKKSLSMPGIEPLIPFSTQTTVLKPQQNTPAFYQIAIPLVSADQKFHYLPQQKPVFYTATQVWTCAVAHNLGRWTTRVRCSHVMAYQSKAVGA